MRNGLDIYFYENGIVEFNVVFKSMFVLRRFVCVSGECVYECENKRGVWTIV